MADSVRVLPKTTKKKLKYPAALCACCRPNKVHPARIHYSDDLPTGSASGSGQYTQHYINNGGQASQGATPHGSPQLTQRLGRHLSKSASELNGHDCQDERDSPHRSPKRAKSAATARSGGDGLGPGHSNAGGVFHKTHGFFNTLRHRWDRAKSKDRAGRKSPSDFLEESTDYAADNSSESSSVTQSPRHRATTIGGSPLAREFSASARMAQMIHRFGGSMEGRIEEHPENGSGNGSAGDVGGGGGGLCATLNDYVTSTQIQSLKAEELLRKKEAQLRQYVFFQLRIHLKSGSDLIAMDKNGLSDPYVKFKVGGRLLHKSRTIHRDLNPVWDEVFIVPIEDPFLPINVKVFDYDWGLQDDFMGSAQIDLTQLELGKAEDVYLPLHDTNHPERQMGEILVNLTLWPRSQEDKEIDCRLRGFERISVIPCW